MRLFAIIIYFLAYTVLATAADAIHPEWMRSNVDLTINTQFDEALKQVRDRIKEYPDDYRACFYLAATLSARMTHFENTADADEFDAAITKTLDLIGKSFADGDSSERAEKYFYQGSSYGYRAFFLGRQGKWYLAISDGIKATQLLGDAIAADSTLYDAYLGMGSYKYWLYSKIKFITWLPMIPDERELGITMIKKSIERNSLSKYMAIHQLLYILADFGREEEGVDYAEQALARYPDSQFIRSAVAHLYFKKRDYVRAEKEYLRLRELLYRDDNRNSSHVLNCEFKLARIYHDTGRYQLAYQYCQEIMRLSSDKELREKGRERFEEARLIQQKCREQLGL
jgi:hypothetical protein